MVLSASSLIVNAQSIIDNLFSKYSGNDNFTSIIVNKSLLDFIFSMDTDKDSKLETLKGKISDLKILIADNRNSISAEFAEEVKAYIADDSFMSLMEIIDGKKRVNLYVKKNNDKVVHLLLSAREEKQEVLLSLEGQFTMKDLVQIGRDSKGKGSFGHLSYLKNLDK